MAEQIVTTLPAGTYYIAVDAWQGEANEPVGPYELEIICSPLSTCVDVDGDGFSGYDAVDCPEGFGTDCCDTGTEGSAGCDAALAPIIFPGSVDFCGDNIDHNCDGLDCCEDTDGDGYSAASCGGRDCCDAGNEDHPGCTSETAFDMNPGADEVCGNAIDENCDWFVLDTCPPCAADVNLSCPSASGSIPDTSTGSNNFEIWCNYGYYGSYENVFAVTPATDGLIGFTASYSAGTWDIFVLTDYGVPGVCNPDACVAAIGAAPAATETEIVVAAFQDQEYFFAVDNRDEAVGAFDYAVACLEPETCVVDETISGCDFTVTGDTTGQDNNISAYPAWGRSFSRIGLEYVYAFTPATDMTATVTLTWDAALGIDLGLFILEDDGSDTCSPYNMIAGQDLIQDAPPFEESDTVTFAAGVTYYLVIDAWDPTNFGPFTLEIDCHCGEGLILCGGRECVDPQADPLHCGGCGNYCGGKVCDQGVCADSCTGGLTECDGWCVDTNSNMFHCGECGNSCMVANADTSCVTGSCVLDDCHEGYDDCNITFSDGCEADLSSPETCGNCDNACGASESCCTGGCFDLQTNVDNCGACGAACDLANVETHGCAAGQCTIGACDTDYLDCDTTASNGCEVDSATDPFNCGDCTNVCALDNVAENGCAAGECTIVTCAADYDDCDDTASTGCESDLTTDTDNCGECDNTCATGAECIDSDCCMDADDDGYYDPDDDGLYDPTGCGAGDDCNDDDDSIYPGAQEVCDGADNDCDGTTDETWDGDNDGYTSCGGDCDDSNNAINPDAEEICGNDVDENCDGEAPACTCRDDDNDNHDAESCGGDDCNDNDDTIYPGADELCGDNKDNDCDDATDEDCGGGDDGGCGCAAAGGSPLSSGLLVMLLVLGLAWLPVRRR